jgi:hypothetical protein
MKTIITYECEICGYCSDHAGSIEQCEQRGVRDVKEVPVGCIFCDGADGFYGKCVFAAAEVHKGRGTIAAHMLDIFCWATRDTGAGDNVALLAPICCDQNGSFFSPGRPSQFRPEMPAFRRMVAALRRMDIEPTLWDGCKAVPLPPMGDES